MEKKQGKPKYGKIEEGCFLRTKVGTAKASNGKELELSITITGNPIIILSKRAFILPWEDICKLAEKAGIFKQEEEN